MSKVGKVVTAWRARLVPGRTLEATKCSATVNGSDRVASWVEKAWPPVRTISVAKEPNRRERNASVGLNYPMNCPPLIHFVPPTRAKRTSVSVRLLTFSTPTEMEKSVGVTELPSEKGRTVIGTASWRLASPCARDVVKMQ